MLVALAVAVLQGCGGDFPKLAVPKVQPSDARAAYKGALAACLACQLPDMPADVAAACEELSPVCDALAGVCK